MALDTREFLGNQRKRAVGSILGHAENARWYIALSDVERDSLRQKVLDAVGSYHDTVLDVVRSLSNDGMTNEAAMDLIQQIHSATVTTRGRSG